MKRTVSPKAVRPILLGGAIVVAAVVLALVVAGCPAQRGESPLPKAEHQPVTSPPPPGEVGQAEAGGAAAADATGQTGDTEGDAGANHGGATEVRPAVNGSPSTPAPPGPTAPAREGPGPVGSDGSPPPPSQAELLTGVELTEDLFVEISAEMVLANEAFTDSEKGRASLDEAVNDILARHRVGEGEFQRYSHELMADPERSRRIESKILQRADALRISKVGMEARSTPRARRPGESAGE